MRKYGKFTGNFEVILCDTYLSAERGAEKETSVGS
jgi:hypothetical protein